MGPRSHLGNHFLAAGCMTNYAYACNYWTWEEPSDGEEYRSCTMWSSTSGFHESEGVISSARDCPCYLKDTYFKGNIVETHLADSPSDCGNFYYH